MGRLAVWRDRLLKGRSEPAAYRPLPEARFNQIGTNYPNAAGGAAKVWAAPNPYAAFDPQVSAVAAPPRDPAAPPAWGTAPGSSTTTPSSSATGTTAPPATSRPASTGRTTPATPTGPAGAGRRASPRRRAAASLGAVAVAGVAVVLVGTLIGMLATTLERSSTGGSGGPPGGYAPELEAQWVVSSYDISKDYGTFDSVDGTLGGELLETSTGWVTMIEPATPEAELVSVEPATGALQWVLPMPEARCTLNEDALLCLTRSTGAQFELVTVAVDTGQVVGEPVLTDLTHVPVFLVMMGTDAVVTMSMAAELTGVDLQGSTLWSQPIDLGDYEVEWVEPDVAPIGSSVILSMGRAIGTVEAAAEGAVVHPCGDVAVTPEAWMCVGDDDAIGYAPDGSELWRGDWHDYYLVDRYQHIAPVMLVDNWDGTVSSIDPLTGQHGQPIRVGDDDASFNFLGDTAHPLVFTYDSVSLLDADLTTVLWTTPVYDEYLNIAGGGIVGDVVAVDAQHSYGFDLATGEMLWERAFLPYDAYAVGDGFVGVQINELIRYELP